MTVSRDAAPAATVLLVEDDDVIAEWMTTVLTDSLSPRFVVHRASDLAGAKALVREIKADLIVSDLTLAGPFRNPADGLILCHQLRSVSNAPIIIVSATFRPGDKALARYLGADDCLDKPLDAEDFEARCRDLAKRGRHPGEAQSETSAASPSLRVGPLTVDEGTRTAKLGDQSVLLTAKEHALLAELVRCTPLTVSRAHLAESVWRDPLRASSPAIDTHIQRLRNKLTCSDGPRVSIQAVRGLGYRIKAD